MKKGMKIFSAVLPLITVALIFALWALLANSLDDEIVLPTVKDTVGEFFALFKSKDFYAAYGNTLLRTVIAFAVSFIIAFVLAYVGFRFEPVKKAIEPIIRIIRSFPTIAMVLWLALFVSSEVAPIIVTSFVVLPTLYASVSEELNGVDVKLIEMCEVFNVKKSETLKKVILPPLLERTVSLCGSGISLNLKLMVAAETLAETPRVIGFLMKQSKFDFNTARLLGLVLVSVLTAVVIEAVFLFIAGRLRRWK